MTHYPVSQYPGQGQPVTFVFAVSGFVSVCEGNVKAGRCVSVHQFSSSRLPVFLHEHLLARPRK